MKYSYTDGVILYGEFRCLPPTFIYRDIHGGIQLQGVINTIKVYCMCWKKTC